MKIKKYILKNCFSFLIPIFIWNIIFYKKLPVAYQAEVFWYDIPAYVSFPENILRIICFMLPIFLLFSPSDKQFKRGLGIYLIGILIYFSSWLVLIFGNPGISQSPLLFAAPAYTTIFWFYGIALMGKTSIPGIRGLNRYFFIISVIFVFFHTWHTIIVSSRI